MVMVRSLVGGLIDGLPTSLIFGGVGAPVVGDPYFDSVMVLLHGEGADASTTITDSSSVGRTFTVNSNAQIDTAQFKYGSASIKFDGVNDVVIATDAADLEIGAQDFTIEGFFRWSSDVLPQILVGKWQTSGNLKSYALFRNTSASEIQLILSSDGSTSTIKIAANWNPVLSTWYHIAADFDGTTYRLYVDGVVVGTATTAVVLHDNTSSFSVGGQPDATFDFGGWADEVRLTIGTARYVGAFTPPTEAFPDVGTDNGIISDILSSSVIDIDATISASYSGSGSVLSNLTTSPSDSTAQSDGNFDITGATFTGAAGDSGAYFEFDGAGDWFDCVTSAHATLANLHRTDVDTPATIVMAFRSPTAITTSNYPIGGTYRASSDQGVRIRFDGSNYTVQQTGVGTTTTSSNFSSSPANATNYLMILSLDLGGGTASYSHAINSRTSTNVLFGAKTTDDVGTHAFRLGALASDGAAPFEAGARMYGFYAFNKVLDNTEIGLLVDHLNIRHGRTYA